MVVEGSVTTDEEGVRALAPKIGKGRVDLPNRCGVEDLDLQPQRGSGFLHVSQRGLGGRCIGWIDDYGNANRIGHQVMQEPQPLGCYLRGEKIDAGYVTAGSGETGD